MAEAEYWGQTEFNMPVKETVESVNNNQLLRTYDTEDSFTRRRDLERLSSSFCLDCVYKQNTTFSIRETSWKFHASVLMYDETLKIMVVSN